MEVQEELPSQVKEYILCSSFVVLNSLPSFLLFEVTIIFFLEKERNNIIKREKNLPYNQQNTRVALDVGYKH